MCCELAWDGAEEDTCRAIIDDGVEFFWEIGPMKQLKVFGGSGFRRVSCKKHEPFIVLLKVHPCV